MEKKRTALLAILALTALTGLTACQFQPLYATGAGTIANTSTALTSIAVAEVDTRAAQQVRNHLIFLLSGGSTPVTPTHEVRLRVSKANSTLASKVTTASDQQIGSTAGTVTVTVSYEIYDFASKEITHSGRRNASASYDRTSQSFAATRAERDAVNRAAREAAEQVRLAIAADFARV